jgi:hypothetical protein
VLDFLEPKTKAPGAVAQEVGMGNSGERAAALLASYCIVELLIVRIRPRA